MLRLCGWTVNSVIIPLKIWVSNSFHSFHYMKRCSSEIMLFLQVYFRATAGASFICCFLRLFLHSILHLVLPSKLWTVSNMSNFFDQMLI